MSVASAPASASSSSCPGCSGGTPTCGATASTSSIASTSRRSTLLHTTLLVPLLNAGWSASEARADTPTSTAPPAAASASPPAAPVAPRLLAKEAFQDVDFQVYPPAGYTSIEMNPERGPDARGPTPERNPIRARFDSPDGSAAVSVLVRSAQVLKAMLQQVTDVSQYGTLAEVQELVVPRGATLIKSSVAQVRLPARKTNLGDLEPPPQNYYRYEFVTMTNLHVIMAVAAQRGRVYVCGGSTTAGAAWDAAQAALRASVDSFRIVRLVVRLK